MVTGLRQKKMKHGRSCHKPHGLKPGGLSLALGDELPIRDVGLYDGNPAQSTNVHSRKSQWPMR